MTNLLQKHFEVTKPLLRYLRQTTGDGITYGRGEDDIFDVFTDATWGTENDRKSFQGWAVRFTGGVTSWAANRQRSTALSSLDSEIMAASDGARKAAWILKL